MPAAPPGVADGFPGERLTILPASVVDRARELPVCRDLLVTHTGRFDHVTGHYVNRPKGRPEYVLIFCLAGRGRVQVAGETCELQQGHGIILRPRVAHRYAADMEDPWSLFWFHFTGRRAADYVAAAGASAARPRFWVQGSDQLAEAFEECYRHVLGGYTDAELIGLSTAFARLLGLCRTQQQSPSLRRRQTETRVLKSMRYMRQNLGRSVSLGELARQAGLSVPHYSAMFKRQLNCSPLEFHIRLRMQRACEWLATTDHTVGEIADALGYEDPLYFSRLFRQKTGHAPSDYRRRHRLRNEG